jgi:hypothetical protein
VLESRKFLKQVIPFETIFLTFVTNMGCCTSFVDNSVLTFIISSNLYYLVSIYLNTELDCSFFPFELVLFFKEILSKKIFNYSVFFYCYFRFTSIRFVFRSRFNKIKSIAGIYSGFN